MSDLRYAYVCHPYGGDHKNLRRAHECCAKLRWDEPEVIPVYVPLLFHYLLDDANPEHRQAGLSFCRRVLALCHEVRVYGDRVTEGMAMEIRAAHEMGLPIVTMEG